MTDLNAAAWNSQASLFLAADTPQTTAPRLEWTQFPGYGPGIEILQDVARRRIVELGCGNGDNTAAMASAGAVCTGVDVAPLQLKRARRRWPHLPIDWHQMDARTYLATTHVRFDLAVSIFGAVGLTPPRPLLELTARRLAPRGKLVFSVPDPDWLGRRADNLRHLDGRVSPIRRWNLTTAQWTHELQTTGFVVEDPFVLTQPGTTQPCCTIVTATKP